MADDCFAYLEQMVEILAYFSYYGEPISDSTWEFCGLLITIANDWAFDYLTEIFAPISNFITRVSVTSLSLLAVVSCSHISMMNSAPAVF